MYLKNSRAYHLFDLITNPFKTYKYFLKSRKDLHFKSEEDIVFVVGAPRSGTTMLYKKLKEQFDVCGFDYETEIFSKKRLSNFKRYQDHPNIREFIATYHESLSRAEFFVQIHRKAFARGRIIEKTPQHLFYIDLLSQIFPKALFIHIVRDPRDAFLSGHENKNIPQAKNVSKYVKYWKACVNKAIEFSELESERIMNLRYEDFVIDVDGNIENIGRFLNEQRSTDIKSVVDPRGKLAKFRKLNQPIDSSSVARWKKSKLKNDLIINSKYIKQELARFNYETY